MLFCFQLHCSMRAVSSSLCAQEALASVSDLLKCGAGIYKPHDAHCSHVVPDGDIAAANACCTGSERCTSAAR